MRKYFQIHVSFAMCHLVELTVMCHDTLLNVCVVECKPWNKDADK